MASTFGKLESWFTIAIKQVPNLCSMLEIISLGKYFMPRETPANISEANNCLGRKIESEEAIDIEPISLTTCSMNCNVGSAQIDPNKDVNRLNRVMLQILLVDGATLALLPPLSALE